MTEVKQDKHDDVKRSTTMPLNVAETVVVRYRTGTMETLSQNLLGVESLKAQIIAGASQVFIDAESELICHDVINTLAGRSSVNWVETQRIVDELARTRPSTSTSAVESEDAKIKELLTDLKNAIHQAVVLQVEEEPHSLLGTRVSVQVPESVFRLPDKLRKRLQRCMNSELANMQLATSFGYTFPKANRMFNLESGTLLLRNQAKKHHVHRPRAISTQLALRRSDSSRQQQQGQQVPGSVKKDNEDDMLESDYVLCARIAV